MTTALAKRPAAKVGKRFPKPSEMTTAALKEHVATGTGVCVCVHIKAGTHGVREQVCKQVCKPVCKHR